VRQSLNIAIDHARETAEQNAQKEVDDDTIVLEDVILSNYT